MPYTTPAHVHSAIVAQIGPLPLERTPEAFHRYLDRWAATAIDIASNTIDLAQHIANRGDADAAQQLKREAEDFFAEFKHIDSMRVSPILG